MHMSAVVWRAQHMVCRWLQYVDPSPWTGTDIRVKCHARGQMNTQPTVHRRPATVSAAMATLQGCCILAPQQAAAAPLMATATRLGTCTRAALHQGAWRWRDTSCGNSYPFVWQQTSFAGGAGDGIGSGMHYCAQPAAAWQAGVARHGLGLCASSDRLATRQIDEDLF